MHCLRKPLHLTALHNRICTTQDTMSHHLEEVILQPPQDLVPQLIGKLDNQCKSYSERKNYLDENNQHHVSIIHFQYTTCLFNRYRIHVFTRHVLQTITSTISGRSRCTKWLWHTGRSKSFIHNGPEWRIRRK